jgi:Ca2+-binding EF-hand superfamily protein
VAIELGEHLTDDEVEKIFSKTDLDGDGYVTSEDFYSIMTHKPTYW